MRLMRRMRLMRLMRLMRPTIEVGRRTVGRPRRDELLAIETFFGDVTGGRRRTRHGTTAAITNGPIRVLLASRNQHGRHVSLTRLTAIGDVVVVVDPDALSDAVLGVRPVGRLRRRTAARRRRIDGRRQLAELMDHVTSVGVRRYVHRAVVIGVSFGWLALLLLLLLLLIAMLVRLMTVGRSEEHTSELQSR